MTLRQYRGVLLIAVAVVALLVASPFIEKLVASPQTEPYTELWLFGSHHNATYPSNVTANQTLHLYLNIANHLGREAQYTVEMKFRGPYESGPDSFNHTASKLKALDTLRCSAANNETVELPLDLSFQYTHLPKTGEVQMENITLNGKVIPLDTTLTYDLKREGFFGNIFFELYLYNETTRELVYNQRYVSLWLQMET
jgi:uncharacterized membrane protein